MQQWWRRIRAAIGMGLTWGAAWFGAGTLLARVPGLSSDLPFALLFAPLGFLSGIVFSGILLVMEGRRGLDRMSLSRFAGWGAGVACCCRGSSSSARPFEGEACGESSWCSAPPLPWRVRPAPLVRWRWPDGLRGGNSPASVGPGGVRTCPGDDKRDLLRTR